MTENLSDSSNESILYEVLEYFVKKQEPEITKFKNDSVVLPTSGTIKNALRYLNNRYSLPESISQQISYTLPWKFAIGDKGRILAILQENVIEIRKSKDEYSFTVGKASVPKDSFPQWRKLVWSPDGSILALASSNGYISFYNAFGNNLFNISPKSVAQNPHVLEAGDAIASMFFKKPRVKTSKWDYEFIRVSYSGLLKSYCISGSEFDENHEFSFGNFYRHGVNSVVYSDRHNLFFVAGNNVNQNVTCIASDIGLTCWRTLNDQPYYKLSVTSQDNDIYKTGFSLWQFIPIIKNKPQSIIFKISLSPNNQFLVCLHTDGTISIWSVPSLKLHKQWKLLEQPNYDIANPLKTIKLKKSTVTISEFQPIDVGWWSDNAVIVARYSGSVTVCSINNLENLLGSSPEFLYNHPQIEELGDVRGFLCLDCEVIITSLKRTRESSNENQVTEFSSDDEKDEDDSQPGTILNYATGLVQSALYSITDIERFQPKRKKSRVFHRTYRLLGLRSTTPEELYSRKIEIEAYEEALSLAKKYNLDPDLVYQTQWRKSEFCINDIHEHLGKVSKRSWVLNECVSRVPETLEATRELLNFGLKGANLETLVAIGIDDNGKFTPSDVSDDAEPDENSLELKQIQKVNKILEKIAEANMNSAQKELIEFRKKLLNHLDKLQVYQILLESPTKFDKKFYEEFRQLSPFENAIKFAKSCNHRGVEIMFTYYGTCLIPHWLTVLTFFPETLNPEKYQNLLPECDFEGRLFLLDQQELRPKDWVERNMFSNLDAEDDDTTEEIYENRSSLLAYRDKEYTQDLLNKWYTDRAYEIERDSRLVDNALALVNIGKSHNINGLERLLFELETLDDLVYKVGLEELSLTEVEKKNDFEKITLLMTNSDESNFVDNIKSMLLPYTRRKKRYLNDTSDDDLLYEYLILLSTDNLALPAKFFESLKLSFDSEILDATKSITTLAVDCIYACNDSDMYLKAKAIFDDTVIHSTGREDISQTYKDLENELKCLQTLNKYEVKVPLHYVRMSKRNTLDAKDLLLQISENFMNIYPTPKEKNWSQMLNDMLDIQEHTFTCLGVETCFEISMVARLKSRSKTAIQGCTNLMEFKKTGRSHLKVSYDTAIDYILQASSDYFNNSKSLTDPDMDLAKECLNLIPDDNQRIKEEYDLIESLQILNEFHIDILPLQVRMARERINLIEDCLNSRSDAYKNKQKLLNLAKYLRVENKNNRLREGKVLNLIAKKSFEMKDYNFCSSVIRQMMKMNYQSAWNIAMEIANCDEFSDLQFRTQCIWFAIHNGPSDMIENFMKRANLLKVQILNADLEKLMPLDNESLSDDNKDEDAERTNRYDAPPTESKEFVPKIVQTSTDIVKSSAQIVKNSTFDLIKNAGNTQFWKSKLNFNFIESTPTEIKADQIIEKKSTEPLQKFSSFYESLHDNCDISSLDTKYAKYSQVDYNSQLKLCQALLRISLLSETASYGVEVSDVNHLLIQCAEHTITEDSIVGLSYLLHLDENYFMDVIDLFENLPQLGLYHQILAYFCSIRLYTKMNPESRNVFLYDPYELIKHMASVKIAEDDSSNKKLKQRINVLMQALKQKQPNESLELQVKTEKFKDVKTIETNPIVSKVRKPLEHVQAHGEVDEWNSWGDEWTDVPADKLEDVQKQPEVKDSLAVIEKDIDTDGWDDEWTDMPENTKHDEKQQLPNVHESLNITEEELNSDGFGDNSTDLPLNTGHAGEQEFSGVSDVLSIIEKDSDGDGWDNEWTDMPVDDNHEKAQQLANPTDSSDIVEKESSADDLGDNLTDMPVKIEQEEKQKLSINEPLIEKDSDGDGWDNEWTDMPVNNNNEEEQQLANPTDSSDIVEKESSADDLGDNLTDMPVKIEKEELKLSINEPLTEKDADGDGWDNEWTDMPVNNNNEEEQQLANPTDSSDIVEKESSADVLGDNLTDIPVKIEQEEKQKLSMNEPLIEKDSDGDGWDNEWTDMPVNNDLVEEQQLPNLDDSTDIFEKESKADSLGDDATNIPVNTEHTGEQEFSGVNDVLSITEIDSGVDGWDDEWTDMPVNEHREEELSSGSNNSSKSAENDLNTDKRDNKGTGTPDDAKTTNTEEIIAHSVDNEADGWDVEWGDVSMNTVNSESNGTIDSNKSPIITESDMPDEKRYDLLVEEISKIQNVDDCMDVKKLLLRSPNIINIDLDNNLDSNLVLRLITKMIDINKINNTADDRILQEIKNFVQEELISQEVFIEYLDSKKTILTPEQLIYLQLCSKEPSIQQAAIDSIKKNYKGLKLNSAIFEEIFFCNLTSSFNVSHELYYKILEEVFTNRTLPEIESNVKLLVENLVAQKNIPHAIALQNQLEGIPPALSTYESCFQLLLRK